MFSDEHFLKCRQRIYDSWPSDCDVIVDFVGSVDEGDTQLSTSLIVWLFECMVSNIGVLFWRSGETSVIVSPKRFKYFERLSSVEGFRLFDMSLVSLDDLRSVGSFSNLHFFFGKAANRTKVIKSHG